MITEYAKNWFKRADEDLEFIEIILKEKRFSFNPICFHAQQAAEKYLKGFLACHDLHVRKIHDLETLVDDAKTVNQSFETLRSEIKFLNQFYIASRYPEDYTEFTLGDAKKAYEAAKIVKELVIENIKWCKKEFRPEQDF